MKNYYLTTGQFAKICNTTKETIYFYTEQGLLQCEKSKENGYFYYPYFEYFKYLTIYDLKMCDLSIDEIKKYLQDISPDNILMQLKIQEGRILEKLDKYKKLMNRIDKIISATEEALEANRNQISIQTLPEKIFFLTEFNKSLSYVASPMEVAECHNSHIEHCRMKDVYIGYPTYALLSGTFTENNQSCMQIGFMSEISESNPRIKECLRTFPAGEYVVLYHHGGYGDLDAICSSLDKLKSFLDSRDYYISGDGYDYELLSHISSKEFNDFVLKLIFPVRRIDGNSDNEYK